MDETVENQREGVVRFIIINSLCFGVVVAKVHDVRQIDRAARGYDISITSILLSRSSLLANAT